MKFFIGALLGFCLLGCQARVTPLSKVTEAAPTASAAPALQPTQGQETHGGDLAVAMVRSAILQNIFKGNRLKTRVSEIMNWPATSVEGRPEEPLVAKKEHHYEINRARLFRLREEEIPYEMMGPMSPWHIILGPRMMRMQLRGANITPDLISREAVRLFSRVDKCVDVVADFGYLIPPFTLDDIAAVKVEYSDSPLFDKRYGWRVDVGVALDGNPRVLLDRERVEQWTEYSYATAYLVFHEYMHILLMKAGGRSDTDHVLANLLFAQCGYHNPTDALTPHKVISEDLDPSKIWEESEKELRRYLDIASTNKEYNPL